jgi:hypothetical protein
MTSREWLSAILAFFAAAESLVANNIVLESH